MLQEVPWAAAAFALDVEASVQGLQDWSLQNTARGVFAFVLLTEMVGL